MEKYSHFLNLLYQKFFQQDLELFADAADKIAEKYKHDPVAEKMILAVAEELERSDTP